MLEKFKKFCAVSAITLVFTGSLFAQVQRNERDIETEQDNIVTKANESAIFENGKMKSVRLAIPNEGEKTLSFGYAEDDKSFTIVDEKAKELMFY